MAKYNPYEINSGYIFSDVLQNWKKYDRKFLATTFQEAIQMVLYNKKIFTAVYKDGQEDYFKNYDDFRYERDLKDARNEEYFPFPDYFLIKKEPNDKYPSIVCYQEPVIITKESNYFDLFFALKITTTDIFEMRKFLEFHLKNAFNNNSGKYFTFLNNLILKYDDLLKGKYQTTIQQYMTTPKKRLAKVSKPKLARTVKKSPVKWKKGNETEFVQLIYALYEADYITNENDQITSLITQIATLFNLPLGKNWQSNLSKSINNRNSDYSPEIFNNLANAFKRYREKQIEKNK